jgi:hypothetical protein
MVAELDPGGMDRNGGAMLPLAGDRKPTNANELADSLQDGLAQRGVRASVTAQGDWPALASLAIRLTKIARPAPLPKASAEPSFTIGKFETIGEPVDVEGVPVTVRAQFSDLGCGFGRAGDGPWQLVIQSAGAGQLEAEAATVDIEQAAHQIVSELASRQGATVKSTKLNLTAVTPRLLRFEISCTAKVFIATATLTVGGQAEIDEHLNGRLSGLNVTGDGMVASMAQGMIQPRLAEYNGKVIPLGEYLAAGLTVSDLRISTGEHVRLEAKFASAQV